MADLLSEVLDFLHQELAATTDSDIEIWYEVDCPLCVDEDGFEECQGHPYSEEGGFLL
jgi:hypothetical protein